MKSSDVRLTPDWLLGYAVKMFGEIDFDPATEKDNPVGANYWCTADTLYTWDGLYVPCAGGLSVSWSEYEGVWCNPPYSRGQVIKWATKAYEEYLKGAEILFLTRADCRTKWFDYTRKHATSVCLINRSVGFIHPEKGQLPGETYGHAVWYFGTKYNHKFHTVFEELGWVVSC